MKAPVEGIVAYVSKAGREAHLVSDPKRYRGYSYRSYYGRRVTVDVFHRAECGTQGHRSVWPGDRIRMHWGGFANLNIVRVELLG